MGNRNFDRLRDVLQKNIGIINIECILSDPDALLDAFSDVLREEYRALTPNELCKKAESANRIKSAALDVLREHIRKAIVEGDYYSAWKYDVCELCVTAQNDVLNEFYHIKKLSSLSAFICHFTDNDNEATSGKKIPRIFQYIDLC